jgi:hypothetical protein
MLEFKNRIETYSEIVDKCLNDGEELFRACSCIFTKMGFSPQETMFHFTRQLCQIFKNWKIHIIEFLDIGLNI